MTKFPGNSSESQVHLSCLRSHTTSLTSHRTCMAQACTLPNSRLAHCCPQAGGHWSMLRYKWRVWQQGQLPHHSLSLALGDGHRHPNLNFSTTNPLLVSHFLAASHSTRQTPFSYWSRGRLQRGERLKINKRRPVPLKEFSFIGSSPFPPFQ